MNYKPDIIIKKKNNELIAAVEIKNRKNLTREIAIDFRRNIMAHGLTQEYHYFLIISQDTGYLWGNKDTQDLDSAPDKEFSMKSIIKKHAITHGKNIRFRESELELIIFQWLNDLTFKQKDYNQKIEKSLYDTGFIQDIQDASIELPEEELKKEIAVLLFKKEQFTLGQASKLAGMNQLQFQYHLASLKIPVHYDVSEFKDDLKKLQELGRL